MARSMTKLLMCALFCWLPAAAAWADGAVYAMTNALNKDGGNQILVFHRAGDGTLTLMQKIATGGGGSGLQLSPPDSLGSLGGLMLDEEHHRLFAVNTETLAANSHDCQEGTITSFLVARDGSLTVADRVMSGGLFPNSLTVKRHKRRRRSLYVLNAGGPGLSPACGTGPNITGFSVDRAGRLGSLARYSMSAINPGPTDRYRVRCELPARRIFSDSEFLLRLEPAGVSALAGPGRVHARRRSANCDGQRDQLDLCLSGRRTRDDRQPHGNAGPRAGASHLFRLRLRSARAPDPDRAVRFQHQHPGGRTRVRYRRSRSKRRAARPVPSARSARASEMEGLRLAGSRSIQ